MTVTAIGGAQPGRPTVPPPAHGAAFAATLTAALRTAGTAPGAPRPVTLGEMVALEAGRVHLSGGLTDPAASTAAAAGPGAAAAVAAPDDDAGGPVLAAAERYLGVPYRWGGTDPATGLDCSGFVQRVFADLGVAVPRVSRDQATAGSAVGSLAEARPGDLLYWGGTGGRPNHIGIYVGDGQMIHAPRTGDVVRYAPVRSTPPDAIRRVG